MPTKQTAAPSAPVPFDDVLRRLLASPPAPKSKPKTNKRVPKPRK